MSPNVRETELLVHSCGPSDTRLDSIERGKVTYRRFLHHLAEVYRVFPLAMQRKEAIGNPRLDTPHQPLLPLAGPHAGPQRNARAPGPRCEALGRVRGIQLAEGGAAAALALLSGGRRGELRVIDGAERGAGEGEVAEVDAAEVAEAAILRGEGRSGFGGHGRVRGELQGGRRVLVVSETRVVLLSCPGGIGIKALRWAASLG